MWQSKYGSGELPLLIHSVLVPERYKIVAGSFYARCALQRVFMMKLFIYPSESPTYTVVAIVIHISGQASQLTHWKGNTMSQFDTYSTSEYAHKLRAFLGMPKLGFVKAAGLISKGSTPKMGRQRYPVETIRALEEAVNAKSARGEAPNSSLGERYKLARDYRLLVKSSG